MASDYISGTTSTVPRHQGPVSRDAWAKADRPFSEGSWRSRWRRTLEVPTVGGGQTVSRDLSLRVGEQLRSVPMGPGWVPSARGCLPTAADQQWQSDPLCGVCPFLQPRMGNSYPQVIQCMSLTRIFKKA